MANEIEREMNLLKVKLNKPTMSGFVVINLKTGKARKPKVGEFRPLVIDHSDLSLEDVDLVMPNRGDKHGKK